MYKIKRLAMLAVFFSLPQIFLYITHPIEWAIGLLAIIGTPLVSMMILLKAEKLSDAWNRAFLERERSK